LCNEKSHSLVAFNSVQYSNKTCNAHKVDLSQLNLRLSGHSHSIPRCLRWGLWKCLITEMWWLCCTWCELNIMLCDLWQDWTLWAMNNASVTPGCGRNCIKSVTFDHRSTRH